MPTKKTKVILSLVASVTILIIACSKNETPISPDEAVAKYLNLPPTPFNYANPTLPFYLASPQIERQINTPANNQVTDFGATLGRVLFYDKTLSKNRTVSCASCHKQQNAFSDFEILSKGFDGGLTRRNSMSLVNAKYYFNGKFFWDQRAATLEQQVLMPVQDLVEMGITLDELVKRVQEQPYYRSLFTQAFGNSTVTSDLISKALAQFVRSIISYQSKYDQGRSTFPPLQALLPDTPFPNFTTQENRGKAIFLAPIGGCIPCHGSETFIAPDVKNNGLDATITDPGYGAVSNIPATRGLFKVTSLRNVELTAPYMHDGRFSTLEQVVEHYNSGVKAHPNLAFELRSPNGQPRLMNLSVDDKAALVAFLKTLTDTNVTMDVKYSNPFR